MKTKRKNFKRQSNSQDQVGIKRQNQNKDPSQKPQRPEKFSIKGQCQRMDLSQQSIIQPIEIIRLHSASPERRKPIPFIHNPNPQIESLKVTSTYERQQREGVEMLNRCFPDVDPYIRDLTIDDINEISGKLVQWNKVETKHTLLLLDMDHSPVITLEDGQSIKAIFEAFQVNNFNEGSLFLPEVEYAMRITERRRVCGWWSRWFWRLINHNFEWKKIQVEKLHTGNTRFVVYLEKLLC